jgi:tRNA A-37 threonylcarbamoyl transferase component Bud32
VGLIAAVWAWPPRRRAAAERAIRLHIVEGRYARAVPYLVKHDRFAEAARLEAWRGNHDRAAKLYERAGDMRGAASVYMSQGDYEMAALHFKEGGLLEEAAGAFLKAKREETAIALLEEAGDLERALEICSQIGDRDKAAALLEKMGRAEDGARILAERAQATGNLTLAASQWEAAGEPLKAGDAWMRVGATIRAGLLALEGGRLDLAIDRLSEGGSLLVAGELLRRQGKALASARLLHQGGYLSRAGQVLRQAGENVVLARLYLKHGHTDHAYRALQGVAANSAIQEDAHRMLVDMLHRDGRRAESQALLEGLIRKRLQESKCDADVRLWVVQLSAILFANGHRKAALEWMRRLEDMGLDTPEMRERIAKLERLEDTESVDKLVAAGSELILPVHERYVFESVIGSGSNGVIYKAHDSRLNRIVAIKMIGRTALTSEIALTFFLREAQTAAGLNHPNIVTIYDIGEMENGPFLAMELIDGRSLAELLEETGKESMPPTDVIALANKLCLALDYAHREGVVHRDVKLENVMVTHSGVLKLMDFGLAKAMHQAPDKTLVITGTPLYMSPEQIVGREVDHRTDLYATGVLVYRLIVGAWPYSDARVLKQHRQDPIPKPSLKTEGLPEAFDEFIARAMAKDPDDRFDTAGQFALALTRCFS